MIGRDFLNSGYGHFYGKRRGEDQYAVRKANLLMQKLCVQRRNRVIWVLTEDHPQFWSKIMGMLITDMDFDSIEDIRNRSLESNRSIVARTSEDEHDFNVKKMIGKIVQNWNKQTKKISNPIHCPCEIDGVKITLPFTHRLIGIQDLDKSTMKGRDGNPLPRVVEGRIFRTDPRDTESMLFNLYPREIMEGLSLDPNLIDELKRTGSRIQKIRELFRACENPIKSRNTLLAAANYAQVHSLLSTFTLEESSRKIIIDVEAFLSKLDSEIEHRHLTEYQKIKPQIKEILLSGAPGTDFGGHHIIALLYFSMHQRNGIYEIPDTLGAKKKWDRYTNKQIVGIFNDLSTDFKSSLMGTHMKDWFIDSCISPASS